jgi:large subunit ribosomal protein L22
MIRGKNINEALAVLQYTNKRAAEGIEKCVRSAVANATEAAEKANIAVDPDDLWVKACFIDMGPTKNRRRMRPAPQGRAYKERRHFHHVTVLLSSEEQEIVKGTADGRKPVSPERPGASKTRRKTEGATSSKNTSPRVAAQQTTETAVAPPANEATTE